MSAKYVRPKGLVMSGNFGTNSIRPKWHLETDDSRTQCGVSTSRWGAEATRSPIRRLLTLRPSLCCDRCFPDGPEGYAEKDYIAALSVIAEAGR